MPMLLAGKNGKGLLEMVIDVDCSDKQRLIRIMSNIESVEHVFTL